MVLIIWRVGLVDEIQWLSSDFSSDISKFCLLSASNPHVNTNKGLTYIISPLS